MPKLKSLEPQRIQNEKAIKLIIKQKRKARDFTKILKTLLIYQKQENSNA